MNALLALMKQYNKAVASLSRAEKYFSRQDISQEEKDSRINDVQRLHSYLNGLIIAIKERGYDVSHEEAIQGFRQVEALKL